MQPDQPNLTIAVLQCNFTVGDVWANARVMANGYAQAVANGATFVVAPEHALCGYPPKDNLKHDAFLNENAMAAGWLASVIGSVPLAFGMPRKAPRAGDYGQKSYNSYVVAQSGRIVFATNKVYLAQGGVFDEWRVHKPGTFKIYTYNGLRIGFPICEDIWHDRVVDQMARAGVDVFIVPNGSPEYVGKPQQRHAIVAAHVKRTGIPMLYVNHVGGQDENAFGGGAFYVNGSEADATVFLPYWKEAIGMVNLTVSGKEGYFSLPDGTETYPVSNPIRFMLDAAVMTTRDYILKSSSIRKVVVAVSGGIDSAVVLAMAIMAVGRENVIAISLPSMHNTETTRGFAQQLCDNLGVHLHWWDIGDTITALRSKYEDVFGHPLKVPGDTAYENTQSRERGQIVMAIANRQHAMLLSTGNKSEMAMGYATLYGDMNGGFNPLKTIYKTSVYQVAYAINEALANGNPDNEAIPVALITQRPSAELDDDQFDENSLPAYPVLDAILTRFIDEGMDPADIIRHGLSPLTYLYGNVASSTFTIMKMDSNKPAMQQWLKTVDASGRHESYIVSPQCVVEVVRR
ncbi:MAG: NAD(+) synthase, partial [Alphaproteobacteria bacterium]